MFLHRWVRAMASTASCNSRILYCCGASTVEEAGEVGKASEAVAVVVLLPLSVFVMKKRAARGFGAVKSFPPLLLYLSVVVVAAKRDQIYLRS